MILVTLVLAAGSFTDDPALKVLRREFRRQRDPIQSVERRNAALEAVKAIDSVEAAEALFDAYLTVEAELEPTLEKRREVISDLRRNKDLEKRLDLDPLRDLQQQIQTALGKQKDPAAVGWLWAESLRRKRMPLSLRLFLVARVPAAADLGPRSVFADTLARPRSSDRTLAVLAAARSLGQRATDQGHGPAVLAFLEHDEIAVREAAAQALAALALPESIEPLILALGRESGRARQRMASALQVLTAQKLGNSVNAWRRWFENEGGPYARGEVPLGTGMAELSGASSVAQYHSIPMDGESILYLIDRSKSMRNTMTKPSSIAANDEETRWARAQTELIRALGRLSPEKKFNIISFAGDCRRFQESMVVANERNVREAQEWVRDQTIQFGTQLYDALELGFTIAGRGTHDGYYDTLVDTMFVLTDGRPYVGNKPDKFGRIHDAVRRWNLQTRVVIHTIGLGDDLPKKNLKKLANDHGGRFVHELSE